jgi:phage-related protein
VWIKAARRDFEHFPQGAKDDLLDALTVIADGGTPGIAKPLTGLGSGGWSWPCVPGDAYRVVYALQIAREIWVIHAFKKKSKSGIKTPKAEIDLVIERLAHDPEKACPREGGGCRLFGQDHAQKSKKIASVVGSTISKNALKRLKEVQ